MTAIPRRTLPVRPTSSECDMQTRALEQGGKPVEVLVKAARDLIVTAAIYEHAGPGPNGAHRYSMDAAGARFAKHMIATSTLQPSDLLEISARIGHAARVLCRYLS